MFLQLLSHYEMFKKFIAIDDLLVSDLIYKLFLHFVVFAYLLSGTQMSILTCNVQPKLPIFFLILCIKFKCFQLLVKFLFAIKLR